MGTMSHINGVAVASISHINGIAKASITNFNGQTFPVNDAVSLSTNLISFYADGNPYGNNYVQVYSSAAWTASVISDSDSIIATYTSSGVNNDYLYVSVYYNDSNDFTSVATIRVTVGTAYVDLTICRDGFIETCA